MAAVRKGQRARQAQPGSRISGASARTAPETLDGVRAERDRLLHELEAARAEIDTLKNQHKRALDRIDWALDSLKSLAEADE